MTASLPVLSATDASPATNPSQPINAGAEESFEALAKRVDDAANDVNLLEGETRNKALELKSAIEAFHKFALTKIVRKLKDDARGKEILFELVDEPSVYALFALHGIVKADLTTRVSRVLEAVKPYMQSHGGDVELVRVEGDTAFVTLHGACNGCSQSAVTLREGVEEAIKNHIAEIHHVEVIANEPTPALVQIGSTLLTSDKGWIQGPRVEDIETGAKYVLDTQLCSILILNTDNRLSAYRNACPHQGLPLDGAMFDAQSCELTCQWHGFKFVATTGECLTASQAQLEAFPLRVQDGYVWVRPD